jgi:hypothetical protein
MGMSGSQVVDTVILQITRWVLTGMGAGAIGATFTEHEIAEVAGGLALVAGVLWTVTCRIVAQRAATKAAEKALQLHKE